MANDESSRLTKVRPPQFRLVLTRVAQQGQFDVNQLEMVEGHDLVELLSKFLVVIARVQKGMERERQLSEIDDDIPF